MIAELKVCGNRDWFFFRRIKPTITDMLFQQFALQYISAQQINFVAKRTYFYKFSGEL
jgi:hypothetical protein